MPAARTRSRAPAIKGPGAELLRHVREDEVIALASDLIKIPSFTTEETPVARFLARFMEMHGLETELYEVEDGRHQVVGRLAGSGGGVSLLYDGHTDIDPLSRGWKRNPFQPFVEGERLYGAGIYNMKSGVAAMVMAAVALKRSGVPLRGDLLIACVVGELQGGVGTVHLLEQGLRIDMAVVPEPHGVNNLMTTHCGVLQLAINTHGVSEHTTRKDEGVDAIAGMAKVIRALNGMRFTAEPRADMPALPRLNIGSILGGRGRQYELRGPNNLADHCTILLDIRFLPSQTPETILADIRRTLDPIGAADPRFRYSVDFPAPRRFRLAPFEMPPCDAPRDSEIVQAVAAGHRAVTGRAPQTIGAVLPKSYSGNDTGHLWKRGIPCVLYGPWDGFVPSVEEPDHYVSLDEMMTCTRTLTLVAADICARAAAPAGRTA